MGREQRANAERRAAIHKMATDITGHAVDEGQLIALGFAAFMAAGYPAWRDMTDSQRHALRIAFFAGAQHLFASVMNMLDPDPSVEPTERDMRRMDLIDHELKAFIEEYKQRHGITDPDIGPPKQTEQ